MIASDGYQWSAPDLVTIHVFDNLPPVAVAKAAPVSGPAPLTVQFDGSASSDPGAGPLGYGWVFGDFTPAVEEMSPTHTYTQAGQFAAQLLVIDELGASDTDVILITVLPPTNTPPAGSIYGTIRDSAGNPLGGLTVEILDATNAMAAATVSTDPWGRYQSDPLPEGDYRIRVFGSCAGAYWCRGLNGPGGLQVESFGEAIPLTVLPDQALLADLVMTCHPPMEVFVQYICISGTVIDSMGRPLAGIEVAFLEGSDAGFWGSTTTNLDGIYEFSQAESTRQFFRVRFSDPAGNFRPQYYGANGADDFLAGSVVDGTQWTDGKIGKCHGLSPVTLVRPPIADAGPDQSTRRGVPVNLDGSASTDPDGNTPLTYAWTIETAPPGSTALIEDPTSVTPTFTPDLPGDYVISLVVTDSLGLSSAPDTVLVSTANTPPVAAAGPDQAITLVGTLVELDGTTSYDLDGDAITYAWSFLSTPAGSGASLSGEITATPSFVPDIKGIYEIQLVVSDPWASSEPDSVVVSFENVKPVASAGGNQAVVEGSLVQLDGTGSTDANGDPLTFSWTLVTSPVGSGASLSEPASPQPTFVADLPGLYVASLVVNDGLLDSDPATVTVTAITSAGAATEVLMKAVETVNEIPLADMKNPNLGNALTNKIGAALADIDAGRYAEALAKLQNDILGKTDGCAEAGAPDKNDWIMSCAEQEPVYAQVQAAIALLEEMLQ